MQTAELHCFVDSIIREVTHGQVKNVCLYAKEVHLLSGYTNTHHTVQQRRKWRKNVIKQMLPDTSILKLFQEINCTAATIN